MNSVKPYKKVVGFVDLILFHNPTSAKNWYLKSRMEALTNNPEESLKALKNAIKFNKKFKRMALNDHAFKEFRDLEEFRNIVG